MNKFMVISFLITVALLLFVGLLIYSPISPIDEVEAKPTIQYTNPIGPLPNGEILESEVLHGISRTD